MLDEKGFRFNVGIIVANHEGKLFWGKRIGQKDAWQFPQGGVNINETVEVAMYRELYEETGLGPDDVEVLSITRDWLYYDLPERYLRHHIKPLCVGQKQKWYLLRLLADDSKIRFDRGGKAEFDAWCWVDYWHPLEQVIDFKRNVYQAALKEFEPLLKS